MFQTTNQLSSPALLKLQIWGTGIPYFRTNPQPWVLMKSLSQLLETSMSAAFPSPLLRFFPPHVCCLKSKMSLAKSQIFMLQYICLPKILNFAGDFTIFLALLQHLRNTSPCRESKAAKQPTEG